MSYLSFTRFFDVRYGTRPYIYESILRDGWHRLALRMENLP